MSGDTVTVGKTVYIKHDEVIDGKPRTVFSLQTKPDVRSLWWIEKRDKKRDRLYYSKYQDTTVKIWSLPDIIGDATPTSTPIQRHAEDPNTSITLLKMAASELPQRGTQEYLDEDVAGLGDVAPDETRQKAAVTTTSTNLKGVILADKCSGMTVEKSESAGRVNIAAHESSQRMQILRLRRTAELEHITSSREIPAVNSPSPHRAAGSSVQHNQGSASSPLHHSSERATANLITQLRSMLEMREDQLVAERQKNEQLVNEIRPLEQPNVPSAAQSDRQASVGSAVLGDYGSTSIPSKITTQEDLLLVVSRLQKDLAQQKQLSESQRRDLLSIRSERTQQQPIVSQSSERAGTNSHPRESPLRMGLESMAQDATKVELINRLAQVEAENAALRARCGELEKIANRYDEQQTKLTNAEVEADRYDMLRARAEQQVIVLEDELSRLRVGLHPKGGGQGGGHHHPGALPGVGGRIKEVQEELRHRQADRLFRSKSPLETDAGSQQHRHRDVREVRTPEADRNEVSRSKGSPGPLGHRLLWESTWSHGVVVDARHVAAASNTVIDSATRSGELPYVIGSIGICAGEFIWEVVIKPGAPGSRQTMVGMSSKYFRGVNSRCPAYLLRGDGSVSSSCELYAGTQYGISFSYETVITVHLDLNAWTMSFVIDGKQCGVAFKFPAQQDPEPLFPVVVLGDDGSAAELREPRYFNGK